MIFRERIGYHQNMHRTSMSQIMAVFGYELHTLIHRLHDRFVSQLSQFSISGYPIVRPCTIQSSP
jgi:hypothetical protein